MKDNSLSVLDETVERFVARRYLCRTEDFILSSFQKSSSSFDNTVKFIIKKIYKAVKDLSSLTSTLLAPYKKLITQGFTAHRYLS